MKQLLALIFIGMTTSSVSQENINFLAPPSSPEATFTQQWVKGEIKINYSRPLARGRKIFGGLVPFDSLWRTGASHCTLMELVGEDVIIGDKALQAGKYSLFTIPGERDWTIIINADTTLHGTTGYDIKKDLCRFKIQPEKTEKFCEAFTIELKEVTARGSGFLSLTWEHTMIRIPIRSQVDDEVMNQINTRLIANKEQNPELLYKAANFYYSTGRDLKQAVVWLTEAEKTDKENFNYPNLLQKIYADLKDYKAAIQAAKRAVILGEKKKMTNTVTNLKKRIAEWENQ